jgi:hypothetical protein
MKKPLLMPAVRMLSSCGRSGNETSAASSLAARFLAVFNRPVILMVVLFSAFFNLFMANAQEPSWDKPYVGSDPSLLYYPDQNSVYVRYGWENNKRQGIVLKGKIPDARYFSFNLYDDQTKSSIFALADYEIVPDENDRTSYTIHIMPEGEKGKFKNLIIVPNAVSVASIFLRYYLPRENIYANVPLPSLNIIENGKLTPVKPSVPVPSMSNADLAKLKSIVTANPKIISGKERKLLASTSATVAEKEPIISKVFTMPIFAHYKDPNNIGSYNFNPGGNYPNKDNHYITMPVVRKKDDILVVRFKAPGYATQLGDNSQQVRYFSLSQGNEYTNTSLTIHDELLRVNKDGYVYVVVANDNSEIKTKVNAMGINFMPWLYKDKLVLILRHMLPAPGFTSSTREVPQFDKNKPAKDQVAQLTIGDYALVGKFFKKSAWKSANSIEQFGF